MKLVVVWSRLLLICSILLFSSCRAQRDQVIIMGDDVRPKDIADPRQPGTVPSSLQSRLVIPDLSIPPDLTTWDRLELVLYDNSSETGRQTVDFYALGTPVTIKPLKNYSLELNAYNDGKLIASSLLCTRSLNFKAQYGTNSFTVSLCAAPKRATD